MVSSQAGEQSGVLLVRPRQARAASFGAKQGMTFACLEQVDLAADSECAEQGQEFEASLKFAGSHIFSLFLAYQHQRSAAEPRRPVYGVAETLPERNATDLRAWPLDLSSSRSGFEPASGQ